MFEESSKQGCLNSSYLLWESNRKAAVSSGFFLSQNNFFTVISGPLLCTMNVHRKKLLFLRAYLLHKQGERWEISQMSFDVCLGV